MAALTSLELCAGAGGQALGLEQAGFEHICLVDNDKYCCETLRLNRPDWNVMEVDLRAFDATPYKGVDLVAGGLPCPPFSVAGKQLGKDDERNLFPTGIKIVKQSRPRAVMFETVRGILDSKFDPYRKEIEAELLKIGYTPSWKLLSASDHGVSQLRPRVILIALPEEIAHMFRWPEPNEVQPPNVGDRLYDLMAARGWKKAKQWRDQATGIAPTIVGGSKKHGGPDLGPTRAKRAWEKLGVNGKLIAKEAPDPDFEGTPYLTVRMVARIQGFPDDWAFSGRKTAAYRQVGNAFPPPVAQAVGEQIAHLLKVRQLNLPFLQKAS